MNDILNEVIWTSFFRSFIFCTIEKVDNMREWWEIPNEFARPMRRIEVQKTMHAYCTLNFTVQFFAMHL